MTSTWNKIDWYCGDCGKYWMTTENCAPCAQLNSWCHCSCRGTCKTEGKGHSDAFATAKCHSCNQELLAGKDLCGHFPNRSQAV